MLKIGKIGRANQIARRKIAQIAEEKGLDRCEKCGSTFGVAPAHKFPRVYYKGNVELLSDFKQWIALCINCHTVLDDRSKTTEESKNKLFDILRP
jgi:hypothetical protein